MSMSLGGSTSSNIVDEAVRLAVETYGIVTTIAAGNSDSPACDQTPARAPSGVCLTSRCLWQGCGRVGGTQSSPYHAGARPGALCVDPVASLVALHLAVFLSCSAAITVSSTDINGGIQAPSCYGSCVDIFSPGVSIMSLAEDGTTAFRTGTSGACPIVAGVAATILEVGAANLCLFSLPRRPLLSFESRSVCMCLI